MIKVVITNSNGEVSSATFATQALADVWLNTEILNNSWGLPDRWVTFFGNTPDEGYTQERIVEDGGTSYTEYFYPQEYTISFQDVTAEYAKLDLENQVRQDENKGKNISVELSALLRKKLGLGQITVEQLAAFVESDDVKKVERYLDKGYLTLVVPIINGGTFSLISQKEKEYFINLLQS